MTHAAPAKTQLGFQIHALVFVLTMVALFAINLLTGGPLWALWVLPGWTIGVLAHWLFAVGPWRCKTKAAA